MNLKFMKTNEKYEKYEEEMKVQFLMSYLKNINLSESICNFLILKMAYRDYKKEICWFWKIELGGNRKQHKQDPE